MIREIASGNIFGRRLYLHSEVSADVTKELEAASAGEYKAEGAWGIARYYTRTLSYPSKRLVEDIP
jgi:hypothetical protein